MYKFDAKDAAEKCVCWIREWFEQNGKGCNAVLGISGGKDSSITAALCVKALGKERVIGVMMPQGEQFDIDYSKDLCDFLDLNLLARLISAEARGESYVGQVAVGAVVLNRVKHSSFPNSISGVIYQPGAFSCLNDGQFWQPVADSSYKAARDALNGWDPSGGAIYYYNPVTAKSKWIRSRPIIATIGKHVFCS